MITPKERDGIEEAAAALRQRSATLRASLPSPAHHRGPEAPRPHHKAAPLVLFDERDEGARALAVGNRRRKRTALISALDFCAETLDAILAAGDLP